MKKIFVISLILLFLFGCNSKEASNNKDNNVIKKEYVDTSVSNDKVDEYNDNNPIKVGIYMYYNSYTNRKRLNEFSTNWDLNVDLCSLEVFYTNQESISGERIKSLWTLYKNEYTNIDNYKIGYIIKFDTKNEGTINRVILSPNDTGDIYDYMQIYLYDDINQEDGAWYSHVEKNEYSDKTILTSIKLTGSTRTNEITSNITLTAFTYDDDDFDDDGNYRGISKDSIIIKRS